MQLGIGLEAIAFQRLRQVFKLLSSEITKVRAKMEADGVTTLTAEILNGSMLPTMLQDASGFKKITLVVEKDRPIDAFTSALSISKMHVFNDEIRRAHLGSADAINLYRALDDVLKGQIDLTTGKVSGAFAHIPVMIGFGCKMFDPKYKFTDDELTSILLHELGHNFTYCFALHYTCSTNIVLTQAVKAIVAADDMKQKHAIMTDVENRLGIKITNQEELTKYDKYENYYVTILGEYREKVYGALGASSYDATMSEQMADMFATRHGAGKALVTALVKLNTLYSDTRPRLVRYYENAQVLLAFVAFFYITIPLIVISVLANDFIAGTYDLDKDRYIRIRNEVTASLKDPDLTSDEKKVIIEEIEVLNKIIAVTDNDWHVLGKIAYAVRSSQRSQARNKRLQQELEALTNNPLYVAAAKYSL